VEGLIRCVELGAAMLECWCGALEVILAAVFRPRIERTVPPADGIVSFQPPTGGAVQGASGEALGLSQALLGHDICF